jgi:hypothetical protein
MFPDNTFGVSQALQRMTTEDLDPLIASRHVRKSRLERIVTGGEIEFS